MTSPSTAETLRRKAHWEAVYARNAADEVSWYQSRPDVSLRLIGKAALPRDAALLDVGGGASTLVDALIDEGFEDLTVLDLSERALAAARRRLGQRGDRARWIAADALSFRPSRTYRLWHDRAVFHFLIDAEEREQYVATLKACLSEDGAAILGTFALDGPERCSGLPVERYDADKLMRILGEEFAVVSTAAETHLTPSGGKQRFAYFLIRRKVERSGA